MLGLGAVVDAEPGVHVEEVQGTRVDGDLDGLALAHLGARVETAHQLGGGALAVSYTHLRAHETRHDLVCRLLLEKKKKKDTVKRPKKTIQNKNNRQTNKITT